MSGSSDCIFFYLLSMKKSLEDRHCCGVIECLLARNVWRIFLRFYLWLWGVWSLRDVTVRDINFIQSCRKTAWVSGGDLNLPPYSWNHNFTSAGSEIFNWQMMPHLKWAKDSVGLLLLWRLETQSLSLDLNHTQGSNKEFPCLSGISGQYFSFLQTGADISACPGHWHAQWMEPTRKMERGSWQGPGVTEKGEINNRIMESDNGLCWMRS